MSVYRRNKIQHQILARNIFRNEMNEVNRTNLAKIEELICHVPDYPKKGILFKDITPVIENPEAFFHVTQALAENIKEESFDKIVAIDARGFVFGAALANYMKKGLVVVRKPNKLPRQTFCVNYELEYGSDSLCMHKTSLKPHEKIVIVDDVLATGGTASATEELCQMAEAEVLKILFLIELPDLHGAAKIKSPHVSLIKF